MKGLIDCTNGYSNAGDTSASRVNRYVTISNGWRITDTKRARISTFTFPFVTGLPEYLTVHGILPLFCGQYYSPFH